MSSSRSLPGVGPVRWRVTSIGDRAARFDADIVVLADLRHGHLEPAGASRCSNLRQRARPPAIDARRADRDRAQVGEVLDGVAGVRESTAGRLEQGNFAFENLSSDDTRLS